MSRALLLPALLGWHLLSLAQSSISSSDRMTELISRNDVILHAEGLFDYNANSLLNELPIALWKGSYLDRDLRGRSRDAMRSHNRVGYSGEARLTYIGPGNGRWRTLMSLAHHEDMGARYTADLFNLTFFGNAQYEARRADIGPSAFTHIRYQTIGFGVRDSRGSGYGRIDLVVGQTISAADIRWADLYTGTDGRVLRSNIRGDYLLSDTASSKAGTLNGFGLAFSGRWEIALQRRAKGMRIELEAKDLGFSAWGANSLRLQRDTTIEFQGITVDDIFDLDAVVIGDDQILDTLGLRYRTDAFTTLLPFTLSATARARVDEWNLSVGLDQRNIPGYVPQLKLLGERRFLSTDVGLSLGFGGFGGLRLGARVTHAFGERVLLSIESPHLPGFVTGRTRGAGLGFALAYGLGAGRLTAPNPRGQRPAGKVRKMDMR